MDWLQRRMARLELNDRLTKERAAMRTMCMEPHYEPVVDVCVVESSNDTVQVQDRNMAVDGLDHLSTKTIVSQTADTANNDEMSDLTAEAHVDSIIDVCNSTAHHKVESNMECSVVTQSPVDGVETSPSKGNLAGKHPTDHPRTTDGPDAIPVNKNQSSYQLEAAAVNFTEQALAGSNLTSSSSSDISDIEDVTVLRQRLRKKRTRLRGLKRRLDDLQRENAELRARLDPAYREQQMDQSLQPQDLVEDIKQAAAETAAQLDSQELAYQPETGLYYDHASGYYWDPVQQMYYDGTTGYYLRYDEQTASYSYVDTTASGAAPPQDEEESASCQQHERGSADKSEELEDGEIDSEEEKQAEAERERKRTKAERERKMSEIERRRRRNKEKEAVEKRSMKKEAVQNKIDGKDSVKNRGKSVKDKRQKLTGAEAEAAAEADAAGAGPAVFASGPTRVEPAPPQPPWLRMIVMNTQLEDVRLGRLHVSTIDGLTVGRDPSQQLNLQDDSVSKYHAVIGYHGDGCHPGYYIRDLGSRNGTYVDEKRISAAKQESEDVPLPHGCELRLGCTTLLCHVHLANDTCLTCEPGHMQHLLASHVPPVAVDRQLERRQVADAIKQKYKLRPIDGAPGPVTTPAAGFQDRAAKRRERVGSSHPHEKTEVAHVTQCIPERNKGFKLLQQMGWREGQGLGKEAQGRVEPVNVKKRQERSGLGCEHGELNLSLSTTEEKKADVWQRTRQRFDKLV